MSNASTRFQDWLRQYLSVTGMTAVECAAKFGVNDSLIGHYLQGIRSPSYDTLQKIKDATDIDMNQLFENPMSELQRNPIIPPASARPRRRRGTAS